MRNLNVGSGRYFESKGKAAQYRTKVRASPWAPAPLSLAAPRGVSPRRQRGLEILTGSHSTLGAPPVPPRPPGNRGRSGNWGSPRHRARCSGGPTLAADGGSGQSPCGFGDTMTFSRFPRCLWKDSTEREALASPCPYAALAGDTRSPAILEPLEAGTLDRATWLWSSEPLSWARPGLRGGGAAGTAPRRVAHLARTPAQWPPGGRVIHHGPRGRSRRQR